MRKIRKTVNIIAAFCLALAVSMAIIPVQLQAAEQIDATKPVSVTFFHEVDGKPVEGIVFSIYHVADTDMVFTETFKDYNLSLENLDSAGLKNLSDALQGYVLRDGITPLEISQTDTNGVVTFGTDGKMMPGVYLILGKSYETEDAVCSIQPILLSLPNQSIDGKLQYDVNAESKYELLEKEQTTQMGVQKIWKDKTTHYRPSKIEVQLIDNSTGKVYSTVTLSKSNNWRHTWTGLPAGHTWSVVEKNVPKQYTVSAERDGFMIILTNTSEKTYTPPSESGNVPDTDEQKTEIKLPQTGTYWWPVPILAAAGMLCIIIGLIRRKRDE